MSEGLSESRHGRRGEGSSRDAAHHHRKSPGAGTVGLQRRYLAQFTAGQVGLVPSAVDGVIPVRGFPPASKHPAQTEERKRPLADSL